MTWRQRQLETIEDQLVNLKISLVHPGSPCRVCGGYQSLDESTVVFLEEIEHMSRRVRIWKDSPWATEEVK